MMYRTAVTIRKISPDKDELDPDAKRRGLIRPVGTYFTNIDRRSIHYPAYYTVTCRHEKKFDRVCLFTIYL